MEDVMLPGFRFHPTDEELVGFYLKRKVQHRPIPIELIKQLDIYKYDPWDLPLPKMANGEKEWYFLCPRDRKYRNSTRPNRVTGGGFWKATGTDRPIYSSGSGAASAKCIGLKKSLVFYKGRAARGSKTDWMMHEFRMASAAVEHAHAPTLPSTKFMDRTIPANDAWAICRIFKKTCATPQRAGLTQNWVCSPVFQRGSISFTPPESEPEPISNISFSPISTHLDFTTSYTPINTTLQKPPGLPNWSALEVQPHTTSENVQQNNIAGHDRSPSSQLTVFSDYETYLDEHLGIEAPSLENGLPDDPKFSMSDAWRSSVWDYLISPSTSTAPSTCGY